MTTVVEWVTLGNLVVAALILVCGVWAEAGD